MDTTNRTASQNQQGPVKRAWVGFFHTFGDPWTIGFLLLSVIFFLVAQWVDEKTQKMAGALLQVLMAASTGVLGGRIANIINGRLEEGILSARGKVAVRGLKLLYRSASSLEERAQIFLDRESAAPQNTDVSKRNLEEIVGACRSIQDEVTSSIENWTDVIPEADIGSAVDVVAELRAEIDKKMAEIKLLAQHIEETEKKAGGVATELEGKLQNKEVELQELKNQVRDLNYKLQKATVQITRQGNSSSLLADSLMRDYLRTNTGTSFQPIRRSTLTTSVDNDGKE